MGVSFKGTVRNGVVVLPPEAKLPDGAEVEVTPLEWRADDPPFLRAILNLAKPPGLAGGLRPQPRPLHQRPSQESIKLTDCISFVVMQDHGLSEALTADHHFEQAGFKAFLA